jgi:acetyl esterase
MKTRISEFILAAVALAWCSLAFAQADDPAKPATADPNVDQPSPAASPPAVRDGRKNKAVNFDAASYLAELSAEGKQRGYQEFTYKQTPQGELRIYFKMPDGWTENDRRPVMVFFFGGGWSGGSPFACVREAEHFAKSGVVVGLADYRVRNRQGTLLDACAEDARSAVRWVRGNSAKLGTDPTRVIVGGGSAGGHIAACTAVADAPNSSTDDVKTSCTPNALFLYYPVASLVDGTRGSAFQRLLGPDLARKLSPAQNVTKDWPTTVLFSGTADIELANGILLQDKAKAAGVSFELYLAEGRGHGVARTEPRDFAWLDYATDFFTRSGIIDKQPARVPLSGNLKKYEGEPLKAITGDTSANTARPKRRRDSRPAAAPVPPAEKTPVPQRTDASDGPATTTSTPRLEPTLGRKGALLLEETFGEPLSTQWTGKTGGLTVADGALRASQRKEDGRLGLFNREQPMQDAAIQIDFKFAGAQGINVSCNPSPGELSKHGHLFSVMITPRMWKLVEHNDKSDPQSQSQALASAPASFEQGRWYTLLLEFKGAEVVARVEGQNLLRASSTDFSVKKPGIEFRVSGRDGGEVLFDNLRVWDLK